MRNMVIKTSTYRRLSIKNSEQFWTTGEDRMTALHKNGGSVWQNL